MLHMNARLHVCSYIILMFLFDESANYVRGTVSVQNRDRFGFNYLVESVSSLFQNLSGLLVQVEQVSGEGKETNSENPGKERGNRRRSDVVHGLAQLRDDRVDHFTSTCVSVGGLDVLLALDSLFVKLFANLGNSAVVVIVVSVVVVVIVVLCGARQSFRGNQWLSRERVSVVHLFVGSLRSMLGACSISEDSSVDTRRSAVSSSVVLDVVAVVVVVVLVLVILSHRLALGEFFEFLFSFFFRAVVISSLRKTCVLAVFFVVFAVVVSVVVVLLVTVGVVVVLVVFTVGVVVVASVLAAVFADLLLVLAFILTRFLQGFLVSLDEFSHLNNVFSTVAARSVGAKLELGNQVSSKSFFALEHRDGSTTIKLEGCIGHPRANICRLEEIKRSQVRKLTPSDIIDFALIHSI